MAVKTASAEHGKRAASTATAVSVPGKLRYLGDAALSRQPKLDTSLKVLIGELMELPADWERSGFSCLWCGARTCRLEGEKLSCCSCGAHCGPARVFAKATGVSPEVASAFLADRAAGGYIEAEMPSAKRHPLRPRPRPKKNKPDLTRSFHVFGAQASGFAAALRTRRGREANRAYRWLSHRGFRQQDLTRFRIGVFPHRWKLDTAEARAYGYLRGRITIPLADQNGRTAGFIGRRIPGVEPAWDGGKYVSSRSTKNFSKGRCVHLLADAAPHAAEKGWLCLTEGYLDAPALHIAGVANTAAAGTRLLAADQIPLIAALGLPVLVAMDSDTAGEDGGDRTERALAAAGVKTGRYRWPAKDAAEHLRPWAGICTNDAPAGGRTNRSGQETAAVKYYYEVQDTPDSAAPPARL